MSCLHKYVLKVSGQRRGKPDLLQELTALDVRRLVKVQPTVLKNAISDGCSTVVLCICGWVVGWLSPGFGRHRAPYGSNDSKGAHHPNTLYVPNATSGCDAKPLDLDSSSFSPSTSSLRQRMSWMLPTALREYFPPRKPISTLNILRTRTRRCPTLRGWWTHMRRNSLEIEGGEGRC